MDNLHTNCDLGQCYCDTLPPDEGPCYVCEARAHGWPCTECHPIPDDIKPVSLPNWDDLIEK